MLIFRYLFREIWFPFIFALVLLGSVMSTGFIFFNLVDEMVQFQFHWSLALKIFGLRLPEMLFYTVPMALLLSTILAVSRLAAERELMAFRLSGYSLLRLFLPFGVFGFLWVGITICLNETLIPPSIWLARQSTHFAKTGEVKLPASQKHLFLNLGHGQVLYAHSSQETTLFQVSLQIFEAENLKQLITAEQATLQDGAWLFTNGQWMRFESQKLVRMTEFASYWVRFEPTVADLIQETRRPLEMNSVELADYIDKRQTSGLNTSALEVRWHQKFAIPVAGFVFVLLGYGLGAQSQPGQGQAFGLSLGLIFGYYFLLASGTALGDSGQIPAWAAAWGANILAAVVGGVLIWGIDQNWWQPRYSI